MWVVVYVCVLPNHLRFFQALWPLKWKPVSIAMGQYIIVVPETYEEEE